MKIKELKKLREIKLSDSEKGSLFSRIQETAKENSPETDAGYSAPSPFYRLYQSRHLKVFALSFLALFVTSATAFASLNSLPGDLLYGVKTEVVEKLPDIVKRNPEDRAASNSKKIDKRISEFEKLAENGELTEHNTRKIEKKIDRNLSDFDKDILKIKKNSDKPEKEQHHLEKELQSKIEKHKEKIEKIREQGEITNKKALQSVLDRANFDRDFDETREEKIRGIESEYIDLDR